MVVIRQIPMELHTPSAASSPDTDASPGRLNVDQRVFDLFDEYVHGLTDRRGFLERASKLATSGATAGMTATALLDALNPRFAEAQQVPKNDRRLHAQSVSYGSPRGTGQVRGYLARPANEQGKLPAVLVVHENRGLNPHIEDIARRLAVAGYLAFAPDALTPLGGYPGDEDKARDLFAKLDQARTREDFVAAAAFLAERSDCDGRVGAVGFCYGGGVVNTLATRVATLGAAVAFYGVAPDLAAVPHIKTPLQLHYAENDQRVNASAPAYEAALAANHVTFEVHRYPGTQHGFNNDTTPRFDKAAAALAWRRTLEFFQKHLRGSGGAAARP
jgi:carboxymethylenebutenolidase